jgi:hypothetical protein
MSTLMSTSFHMYRSLFNKKQNTNLDFSKFDLISKLPSAPYYNQYKFIPIIHKTNDIPQSGLYFNKQIGCADDMVYQTLQEFNHHDNKYIAEYKALGFGDRLKQVMMNSAQNVLSAKAKYIIFTCNSLGVKYGNPIIGIFENTHKDADPNIRIEYEIYNVVK